MRAAHAPGLLLVLPLLAAAQPVEFNRDIRPLLSDRCWSCHGTDAAAKGIRLRLDQEAAVAGARDRILTRLTTANRALRMPPAHAGPPLTEAQTALLGRWIAAGTPWQKHWAYLPPRRAAGGSIDGFVRERLRREGLSPAPAAAPAALLRRVTLDLTGLPPTLAELDAFLADPSPAAYARAVDRLLASPRYAERMTARWLDAARYADTNGYQTDGERDMWRWRDWVLDAFARNQPFDQFVLEQLAGDLLPNATLAQRIATGFQRNHRGNGEGGIVAEEYLVEYAVDRVETMSTVLLGSTIGCARCHNHKYDPFSQKEFYQLFAFFHNIGERGRYFKFGNTPPFLPAPTADQQRTLDDLDRRIAAAEARLSAGLAAEPLRWQPSRDVVAPADAAPGYTTRFSVAARLTPSGPRGAIISKALEEPEGSGWALSLEGGKVQVNLVQRWLDDALRVESERVLAPGETHHIAFTYDGSKLAAGIRLYIDGQPAPVKVLVDELNQDFLVKDPVRIGGGQTLPPAGRIAEPRIFLAELSPLEAALLAGTASGEAARRRVYLETSGHPAWTELVSLRRERQAFLDRVPTVMVMREMERPLPAHVLIRGAYDRPGDPVSPDLPAILGALPAGAPPNRLTLARWIVSPENPLTARVTVNRIWQGLFGTGIVKTVEDFGSQGEWPSHPELLDWLAVELVESGWDLRHLLRTIVLSETYRQSSQVTPEALQRDPENRLLARGPRLRLDAGEIRDQALAAAGLLVEETGGPSVKPYQPAGLWKELSGGADYRADSGPALYRRSLYTFWKRTSPPPSMANFDAAGREICVVRESRTNTPLQALNLMNDVTFLEASRKLAERMLHAAPEPSARLAWGFRLLTGRAPTDAEAAILGESLAAHRATYAADELAARNLLAHGDSPRDPAVAPRELAAYATVASLLLNLDEVITKP